MRLAPLLIVVICVTSAGCASKGIVRAPAAVASQELPAPSVDRDLRAMVVPPIGWQADPLKHTSRHDHRVWLAPSGHTAYGIIHFSLPLPVGHELTLRGFLDQMEKSEGEATLIEKRWDENLEAMRFVADGGMYRVRTNLFVRGFEGWAVYAGTLRKFPVDDAELELAERARERTGLGLSDAQR